MNIVVIDPAARTIKLCVVSSFDAARKLMLSDPWAISDITETHMLAYQPFAPTDGGSFFFSRKMEQHYAGTALVVGATVDRRPTSCGRGIVAALEKDILFLGNAEQAKRTLSSLAKFEVGKLEPGKTAH